MANTTPKLKARALNLEGLLRLLGGTPEDRLRFWEILKGITTPAEFRLVNHQMEVMQNLVKQVEVSAKELKATASKIAK